MIPQSYILESVASFVSYVYAYTYKYFRNDLGTSFGVARYRRVCRRRHLPMPQSLEEVLDSMEGNPQLNDHPVLLRESWKKKAIPLCIHGDGVPLTGLGKSWSKFMDVFTVSSI